MSERQCFRFFFDCKLALGLQSKNYRKILFYYPVLIRATKKQTYATRRYHLKNNNMVKVYFSVGRFNNGYLSRAFRVFSDKMSGEDILLNLSTNNFI